MAKFLLLRMFDGWFLYCKVSIHAPPERKKRKKEIRRLFSNFPETKGLKIAGKSINGLVGQVSGVD